MRALSGVQQMRCIEIGNVAQIEDRWGATNSTKSPFAVKGRWEYRVTLLFLSKARGEKSI